jgi:cytoskeletal protein RodZ
MTPSGTPDSRTTLPEQELGALLRHARNEQQRSVAQVARVLILSSAQINGIESGSLAAFHNRTYYLRALKKYLNYMGIGVQAATLSLLAQLEQQTAEQDGGTSPKEASLLVGSVLDPSKKILLIPNKRLPLLLGALAVLVVIGLIAFALTQRLPQTSPDSSTAQPADSVQDISQTRPPITAIVPTVPESKVSPVKQVSAEQTIPEAVANPAIVPTAPATAPAQVRAQDAVTTTVLRLSFTAPSWVQLIALDGKRFEKIFTAQETLDIDPATTASVVIGNARQSSLTRGESKIDLTRFINPNSSVARLSQQDLHALVTP